VSHFGYYLFYDIGRIEITNAIKYYIYLYKVENIRPDSQILVDIVQTKMPFGKYKDTLISDIPISYLEWMHNKGFPPGKLGMMLSTVYEIKINGLTDIIFKVKRAVRG
jgi:uncharacterized protein (DUF3820 family)